MLMEFYFFIFIKNQASPYINHFLQPDTLISDYTNPQTLNRYSYVGNRPVNFNDPTGHMQDEGDGSGSKGCNTALECGLEGSKRVPRPHPNTHPSPNVFIHPSSTYLEPTPPASFWSGFQTIWDGGKVLNNAFDFVIGLDTATTLFEKGFKWGKAVNPNPVLDGGLGVVGQIISDLDRGDLTLGQRGGRAIAVGFESVGTGIISDLGGAAGFGLGGLIFPEGGEVVGYAGGLVLTSLSMDEVVWKEYNQDHFDSWGLGSYP